MMMSKFHGPVKTEGAVAVDRWEWARTYAGMTATTKMPTKANAKVAMINFLDMLVLTANVQSSGTRDQNA